MRTSPASISTIRGRCSVDDGPAVVPLPFVYLLDWIDDRLVSRCRSMSTIMAGRPYATVAPARRPRSPRAPRYRRVRSRPHRIPRSSFEDRRRVRNTPPRRSRLQLRRPSHAGSVPGSPLVPVAEYCHRPAVEFGEVGVRVVVDRRTMYTEGLGGDGGETFRLSLTRTTTFRALSARRSDDEAPNSGLRPRRPSRWRPWRRQRAGGR